MYYFSALRARIRSNPPDGYPTQSVSGTAVQRVGSVRGLIAGWIRLDFGCIRAKSGSRGCDYVARVVPRCSRFGLGFDRLVGGISIVRNEDGNLCKGCGREVDGYQVIPLLSLRPLCEQRVCCRLTIQFGRSWLICYWLEFKMAVYSIGVDVYV